MLEHFNISDYNPSKRMLDVKFMVWWSLIVHFETYSTKMHRKFVFYRLYQPLNCTKILIRKECPNMVFTRLGK